EQVPYHAPTPDITIDDIEVNTSDTDAQTQTAIDIPEYMRGNENLQDELDTFGPTSSTTVQSNGHSNPAS
ncbi:32912_t:CDS:2, partial [Gigaspora margarita]